MTVRLALGFVLLASCSITVTGVTSRYEARAGGPPPDCTSSAPGRALLDVTGVLASAWIANFAYNACFAHEEDCSHPGRAAPFIGLAAVYAAATVYGVVVASRCSAAKTAHTRLQTPSR